MQVSVEKTSELSRKMTVSIPEATVQEKMATHLKSIARTAKIHGFRPGKVPQSVIQNIYGDQVRSEIAGDLIQNSYIQALTQENLRPAGFPHIEHYDDREGGFRYIATFEVYPEIVIDDLSGLEVERPVATVTDADVDSIIGKLRDQRKTWSVVERAVQHGDQVTINFEGVSEGANFTEGKVENYPVEVGAKNMIAGFEDALLGLNVGDSKTFDVTFPAEYGNPQLAGKDAQFTVEVVTVSEPVLPEIDEEFIKAYGVENGTVDSFRTDVQENLARELKHILNAKLKNAVMEAVYKKVPVSVPRVLIDEEIQNLMKPYIESAKKQGIKLEEMNLPAEGFEEQAHRRVALGLLLSEIVEKNSITVNEDKVRATVEDLSKSYESPEDVVNWYYADEKRLQDVQQMVLEDQVVEFLLAQATVTESVISFSDVMDKPQ